MQKLKPKSIPVISGYEYFIGLASDANKKIEKSYRHLLKNLLLETYKNSCDLFPEDLVHTILGFSKNPSVQSHIQNAKDQRTKQKNFMLERIDKAQVQINSLDTPEILKAAKILKKKGIMNAIEFIKAS